MPMWSPEPSDIITADERAAAAAAEARKVQFPPLDADQFWYGLHILGVEPAVRAWLANLNDPGTEEAPNPDYDPRAWAWVSSKLDRGRYFERDDPWLVDCAEAISLPGAELDFVWQFAAFGL